MKNAPTKSKTGAPHRLLPIVLLVVLGCIWSLGPSATKFAAINNVPPIGMVFWQTFIAANLL